jgi:hypothetical protein
MSLWVRPPKHPHIVPFDKIVVDELEGRVLGSRPSTSRVVPLKRTETVYSTSNELNLNLGIAH